MNGADFTVDFWNVGQGDCSSIARPDGSIDVIDAGPVSNPQLCDWLTQAPKVINALVITHNDRDHIGGVAALLEIPNLLIRKAYLLNDGHKLKNSHVFKRLFDRLGDENITRIERKLTIDEFDEYRLVVRYPSFSKNIMASKANDTSAIISLTWNDQDVIVWGADNSISTINANVAPNPPMLFGPHHGAPDDVSDKGFEDSLAALSPSQSFLSYGTINSYNHPNTAYIKALAKLNCRITCAQRCRRCGLTNENAVLDGDGFYYLTPPRNGLACHGHLRLEIKGVSVRDELEAEYEDAKARARNRLCLK